MSEMDLINNNNDIDLIDSEHINEINSAENM